MTRRIHVMPADEAALRVECEEIDSDTEAVRDLARDMGRLMRASGGIGLAAPQVGASERLIVVSYACVGVKDAVDGWEAMLNPEILWASEEQEIQVEGCLSLPGRFGLVQRPKFVIVAYKSLTWTSCTRECHGLFARCVQHEIDHLDGVLISDEWLEEVHSR